MACEFLTLDRRAYAARSVQLHTHPTEAPAVPIDVVVAGGGHAAQALAGELGRQGHRVRMLEYPGRVSRLDEVRRSGAIHVLGCGRDQLAAIELVTTDAAEALNGADMLVIAVPAFAHAAFAELTVPHLRPGQLVVVFTASFGGLEWVAAGGDRGEIPFTIVEADNLPFTARVTGPAEVTIHLDVPELKCSAFPASRNRSVETTVCGVFPQMRFCRDLLEPALCNMNGVVHPPALLLNIPRIDRSRGQPWWIWEVGLTPTVAAVIERSDAERLAIGEAFGLELPPIAEIMWRSGYGPRGTIYEAINGCAAIRDVRGPTSLEHRWITEDIPYALRLWVDLARVCGVPCPTMTALTELACAATGRDFWAEGRTLASFGQDSSTAGALLDYLETGHA